MEEARTGSGPAQRRILAESLPRSEEATVVQTPHLVRSTRPESGTMQRPLQSQEGEFPYLSTTVTVLVGESALLRGRSFSAYAHLTRGVVPETAGKSDGAGGGLDWGRNCHLLPCSCYSASCIGLLEFIRHPT